MYNCNFEILNIKYFGLADFNNFTRQFLRLLINFSHLIPTFDTILNVRFIYLLNVLFIYLLFTADKKRFPINLSSTQIQSVLN
jgi:hypothetical protein